MKETLTRGNFVALLYRTFGTDIDQETWEGIYEEMLEEFNVLPPGDCQPVYSTEDIVMNADVLQFSHWKEVRKPS